MTNFNFLLNNLSYLSNEDLVVRPMDSTCFRSAPVPPSFRLRLHPLRMVATLLLLLCLGVGNVWGTDVTGTINFGSRSGSLNINSASVSGNDSQTNSWTVTTVGTTSFTPNASYAQVGSSKNPATSITFTTTLAASQTITAMSAKFGGFSGTAGTITLKVGDNTIGTGSLSASTDVTVTATDNTKSGKVLTVTVTGISKGVKCYYISYTYSNTPACSNNVTINKGTPVTGSSFSLDKTGSQATCNGLTVTVSGITPPSHYHFSAISQSGVAANKVTIDNSAKTVTYAANTTGTSTINIAYEEDPQYTVTWVAGGNSSFHTQTSYTGTALTAPGTPDASTYCPGGKVFVGWTATEIDGTTNTQPADLFTSVSGMSIPATNKTYYAVFATSGSSSKTYSFSITASYFNSTSYAANNNEKTSTATATDASGATMDVKWTSNQIMLQSSAMQWQKNNGYIYNSTDLGTINSVTVTSSAGTFTTYYGTTSQPSSGTQGTGNGYFKTSVGNATGTTSNVAVNFTKTTTSYSNYATTCCTPLGSINGSVSWSNGQATVSWDAAAGCSSWTLKYKAHDDSDIPANWTTYDGAIGTAAGRTSNSTAISGLTAGTEYDFKITGSSDGTTYCAGEVGETTSSTVPQIIASGDLTGSDYAYNDGSGTVKTFDVSGVGLVAGSLTFSVPTSPTQLFEISTDNGVSWGSSKTLAISAGTLSATTIKVRLKAGFSIGSYGPHTITISGGGAADNTSVTIAGSVTSACTEPTVAKPTLTSIASGTITVSCASVTVDENCDVTEYGFVWNESSDPTISDNKTPVGSSTPASGFNDNLSISFTTGTTYKIKAYAINSAGTTLSATLSVTPQSVTFVSNGGSSVATAYVYNGGTVSKPSNPTLANYDFDNWYTDDKTFESAADFSSAITEDKTYYANWTETLHDVTVEYKCGSTTVKASTTIENVGVVTTGSTTAPNDITGYTWSSWSAMPSGVTTSTTPLTTRDITINATADGKTITANYTANQYAITYKDKGDVAYSGNNEGSLPSTHTYGSATALVNGAKSGYDFEGWFTDDDCTISAGASIGATAVTAAFTLYAKWAPSKYDVTLKKNGKTAAADQVVRVTYGSAMPDTIKAVGNTAITVPTQNGYTFKGYWDTSASTGGKQYYSYSGTPAVLESANTWDKTSDTNLFGRWEANVYTVTFDNQGADSGHEGVSSIDATYDAAMPSIAENLPTKTGYRFDGYYTMKNGGGTKYYNANGTYATTMQMRSATNTLYAKWVAQTTFSVNGVIDDALTIDDNAAMPSADVPTACGDCWSFLGWSTDDEEDEAAEYASGDTHTFGTPTTLYAVYGQVEYKMITSTDGLVANDNYVIASSSDLALSNADHSYYSTDAASSDISSISRLNAGSISVYNPTSNIIWKFTGTYSSGQLYNTAASKYVNLDASKVLDASSQNLTFSVNDDGETWTIKSSTPKYLHGYVDGNGDGFESLTSSYWDEDENFSAYILHQTSSTVTTTPNCLTYDIVWKVGNDEASGTPTDNTTTCTGIEELPDDPDDNALDCATKFMGWSESILTGEGKSAPADLFTTAGGAPKINEDKTFHAVFASVDTESETPTNLTSEFTSSSWADANSLWTSGAAGNGYLNSGVQVTSGNVAHATTKASYNKVDSVEVTYCTNASKGNGGIKIEVGGTKIDSIGVAYTSGTGTNSKTIKFKSASLPLSGTVKIHAKGGSTSSIYIQSVKIYYRDPAYKDYMTICCDKSITIGTPSITGSGTVTFTLGGEDLDPGDDVETCTSAKDVVATVTPEAGYKCTSVSFTGVTVSIDPTPGSGNYPAAPSTQDYTLSFAKNTTSGTLATSATFEAKALEGWTWKYKKGNVGNADPASDIPDVVEAYIGEYVRFIIDGYAPSDVISDKQGYVYDQDATPKQPVYNTDSLAHVGHTTGYYTTRGKVAGTATIKFKAVGDASIVKTMTILTKALPSVTFVDKVQDKTDFTNWGTDGVVSSTLDGGVVTHTKPTPSHSDVSDPGSNYNTCERQHLHLVGWIRSDWADEHPSATHSQITSVGDDDAGNPYYYTAGADIDVEAQNGKTFYAVWSKIE